MKTPAQASQPWKTWWLSFIGLSLPLLLSLNLRLQLLFSYHRFIMALFRALILTAGPAGLFLPGVGASGLLGHSPGCRAVCVGCAAASCGIHVRGPRGAVNIP